MFFVLKSPQTFVNDAITDYFAEKDFESGDPPTCPTCQNVIGMRPWLPPFRAELVFHGRLHGDVAFGMSELLVSERFTECFVKDQLVGLEILGPVTPVTISPKKMKTGMPQYFVARATRSQAFVDIARSGLIFERPHKCRDCRLGDNLLKIDQLIIDPSSWCGEDLFLPRGIVGPTVASENFARWVLKHQLRNVNLLTADCYRLDYSFMAGSESRDGQ